MTYKVYYDTQQFRRAVVAPDQITQERNRVRLLNRSNTSAVCTKLVYFNSDLIMCSFTVY